VTDRSIRLDLYSAAAVLSGKTQARVLLRQQPPVEQNFPGAQFGMSRAVAQGIGFFSLNDCDSLPKHPTLWDLVGSVGVARDAGFPTSYDAGFAVGDRLFVQEPWSVSHEHDHLSGSKVPQGALVEYLASDIPFYSKRRTAMQMPRWASRTTLEVEEVRVQRLQDITRDDAMAEGIVQTWGNFGGKPPAWALSSISRHGDASGPHIYDNRTSRENYGQFWDRTASRRPDTGWADNPWVVALTFKVTPINIDKKESV
jgi:hypothetical protein